MTSTPKRKLIEVALPLEVINRESAREKSIRHGHPSTLHLWWARRPLAACRAVLFAQLVDDPSSYPERFDSEEAEAAERARLFRIMEQLVVWENLGKDSPVLRAAHKEILNSTSGNPPAILDPFAGGGSIPLEAQRLGLEAHASDLNPVPVLINKALIEFPPKWADKPPVFPEAASELRDSWVGASGLAEDVRRYGQWICQEAERRIGHLYPKVKLENGSGEATVIAWIWGRTVQCPNPACGIQMPLVKSWWLGKKKGKEAYVVPKVENGKVTFTIGHELKQAPTKDNDGTVQRTGALCIGCGHTAPLTYVRQEGKARRLGQQLLAIAAEGKRRRIYLAPTKTHEDAARVPCPADVPDTELPKAALGFRVQGYGMSHHADLFTNRQLTALTTFCELVGAARERVYADALAVGMPAGDRLEHGGEGAAAYADAVAVYLASAAERIADRHSSVSSWDSSASKEQVRGVFARQAVSMVWDFAEGNFFGNSSGNLAESFEWVARVLDLLPMGKGQALHADASSRSYEGVLVSTDPPYYDNVGYADLSDFFYIWLRRSLSSIAPSFVETMLTPKSAELVADPFRHPGPGEADRFFEAGFERVFANIRRHTPPDFPITVFYAFKQAETDASGTSSTGWETLLEGMISSGWAVTGTWPIRTELGNRMRGVGSNALASSIVLACRPRPSDAVTITRRAFQSTLRSELPNALRELQQGAIAPVDLAQAAIGPGMAVFSRHAAVVESDGTAMTVHSALKLINRILDEVLADQDGDFDAETRFCVKWFEQFGWNESSSGTADTLSRATNTTLASVERGGAFRARGGRARLIPFEDLQDNWNPAAHDRISVWEVVLHLAKTLNNVGGEAAARLMSAASTRVDLDAAQELAYRLFSICEKRGGHTQDAILFNGLGQSWSDLSSASHKAAATAPTPVQEGFDFED